MPDRTRRPSGVQHRQGRYPDTPRTPSAQIAVLLGDLRGIQRSAGTAVLLRYVATALRHGRTIVSHRSLVPADHWMPPGSYAFRTQGAGTPLRLDTSLPVFEGENLFGSAREIYCRRVYNARPGFTVHPGDVVFDLGANVGLFTTMAAVGGATVVAVEAQSGFVPCIHANLRVNGVMNGVYVHHALIAGTIGVVTAGRSAGDHWYDDPPDTTIPALLEEHHLDHIDLLKIDIEGSEFALLTPYSQWLHSVSRIVMEVHRQFGDPSDLADLLGSFGFKVELLDQDSRPTATIAHGTGYLFAHRLERA